MHKGERSLNARSVSNGGARGSAPSRGPSPAGGSWLSADWHVESMRVRVTAAITLKHLAVSLKDVLMDGPHFSQVWTGPRTPDALIPAAASFLVWHNVLEIGTVYSSVASGL